MTMVNFRYNLFAVSAPLPFGVPVKDCMWMHNALELYILMWNTPSIQAVVKKSKEVPMFKDINADSLLRFSS